MMLHIKYESSGPCSFRQEDFWKLHFENLMFNLGDHPGIIPSEFGQILISGSKEEVDCSFSYIIQCKIVTPGAGSILTPGA